MTFRTDMFSVGFPFGEEKEREIRIRTTKHKFTIKSGINARNEGFLVAKKWCKEQKSVFLHV